MRPLIVLTFTALLTTAAAAQTPLRPEGFAYRGTVTLGGAGPFHQVALPLPVYKGVARADLGDLRVFNKRGEALPYALLRSEARTVSRTTENTAPFFPLRASGNATPASSDIAVTVRQLSDGKLVSIREQAGKSEAGDVIRGVVVDASALKGSVRSLRLVTGASAAAFHSYTIESSQDLQHWRVLKYNAQLVHLEHAGHRVDNDAVEWDSAADRYLRLVWENPQNAPRVESVLLGTVETSFNPPIRIWSEEMAPAATQPGIYEYAWTGQMPLERLRINLPQINTLAPLDIQTLAAQYQGRHRHRQRTEPQQRWENAAQTVAYRLQTPQGEVRSADVTLYGAEVNRVRLAVDARSGGIGEAPPTVQIGFVPHVLVFLARGDGPFVLTWGASDVAPADLSVTTLMPGADGSTLNASPASLSVADIVGKPIAQAASPVPEASPAPSKWILWVVLLAGLLVLGGMAWSLIGQLRQPPKSGPSE